MTTPGGAHADETAEIPRPPPSETLAPPRPASGGRTWIGGRFDDYEVTGELGRGGGGVVLRARDSIKREVALKTLHGAHPDPTALLRFRREAEALAALDHANVIKVHAVGDVAGRPYLVFELIAGARSLDAVDAPLEARVRLVRDAARGLGHAHARGIVHRDVKANNLLVDDTGRLRVTDFGLAMFEDGERLTKSGFMVGTPLAMAPEQVAADRASIGPATDVWGLGVVLYQVLTGKVPLEGETLPALLERIRAGALVRPRERAPEVSPLLEAVCLRALEPSPADRWANGDAMADALDAALRGEASPSSGSSARRRFAVVAGVVAALVVVSLLVTTTTTPAAITTTDDAPSTIAPSSTGASTVDPLAERRARLVVAANGGDPAAMAELGDLLAAGQGGPVDLEAALVRLRRAAELGHAGAAAQLARRHREGDGVAKDLDEAIRWFRRALDLAEGGGSRAAARELSLDLAEALNERRQLEDLSEAANLMTRWRDEGDPRAMLMHAEHMLTLGLVLTARTETEELTRRHPGYEVERADELRRRVGLPPMQRRR